MQGYNDFYRLTEGYLRNYMELQAALDNLRLLKSQKETELQDAKIPTAKYGIEPGTPSELTQPEAHSERNMELRLEIQNLDRDIQDLILLCTRVESALSSLDAGEKKIIAQRYMGKRQWKEICGDLGYSERQCQRRTRQAVGKICRSLFGHKMVVEKRFWFVR